MSDPTAATESTEWPGACLCGAVTFRIRRPVTACVHCHCTMCQRSNGAGHVTWIALPAEQLVIDRGEDQLIRYPSSDHGSRLTQLLSKMRQRAVMPDQRAPRGSRHSSREPRARKRNRTPGSHFHR